MASWQAHFLDLFMRVQVKRRLRHEQTDIALVRRVLSGGKLPVPAGVSFHDDVVGGIKGEWVSGQGTPKATLLYLHGGGYFACSPRSHRPITSAYAQNGFSLFVPDYRLAPEHPFPAAIEDAEAAWNGLLSAGHAADELTVSGDSAGGGLTLALLLTLRDKGAPLPAAAALLSPWTDLAATGASIRGNARREAMFTESGIRTCSQLYLAGQDPKNPLASPVYADLKGLPPLLIHAGDREMLRDDSTRLAERARAAGVSVELRIWPVVPHVWHLAQFVPESRESMRLLSLFLLSHVPSTHMARQAA
jgi:acetyl esterase/lipase